MDRVCYLVMSLKELKNDLASVEKQLSKYQAEVKLSFKAKFHYASWFGASSELAPNMFEASSELASVMEFGFYRYKTTM